MKKRTHSMPIRVVDVLGYSMGNQSEGVRSDARRITFLAAKALAETSTGKVNRGWNAVKLDEKVKR
jgi:hypothetical protein